MTRCSANGNYHRKGRGEAPNPAKTAKCKWPRQKCSRHTWKKKFKMPFKTVMVENFKILGTSMLMVRIL